MPTSLFVAVGHDGLRMSLLGRDELAAQDRPARRARPTVRSRSATACSSRSAATAAITSSPRPPTARPGRPASIEAKYVRYIRGLTFGERHLSSASAATRDRSAAPSPSSCFSKDGLAWDGPFDVPGQEHPPPRGLGQRPVRRRRRPRPAGRLGRRQGLDGRRRPSRPSTRSWTWRSVTACSSASACTACAWPATTASPGPTANAARRASTSTASCSPRTGSSPSGPERRTSRRTGQAWNANAQRERPAGHRHGRGALRRGRLEGPRCATSTDAVNWREAPSPIRTSRRWPGASWRDAPPTRKHHGPTSVSCGMVSRPDLTPPESYATTPLTTSPFTSVSRISRPA